EDEVGREEALSRTRKRFGQALAGGQAPYLDQAHDQEQTPASRLDRRRQNQRRLRGCDASVRVRGRHAKSQTWCDGPRAAQEGACAIEGLSRPAEQRLQDRETGGHEGRPISISRPPPEEARISRVV